MTETDWRLVASEVCRQVGDPVTADRLVAEVNGDG